MLVHRLTKTFHFFGSTGPVGGLEAEAVDCLLRHPLEPIPMVFQSVVKIFELIMTERNIKTLTWH